MLVDMGKFHNVLEQFVQLVIVPLLQIGDLLGIDNVNLN